MLSRGRGHIKEKQPETSKTTKISDEHGCPVVRLPSAWERLGVKLDQDILVDLVKGSDNPLAWEIRIKPRDKS